MRTFTIRTPQHIPLDWSNPSEQDPRTCGTWEGAERRGTYRILVGNLKERYYLENLDVGGMIILKRIFKNDMRRRNFLWTNFTSAGQHYRYGHPSEQAAALCERYRMLPRRKEGCRRTGICSFNKVTIHVCQRDCAPEESLALWDTSLVSSCWWTCPAK
jgi:hypothetical protein